MDETFRIRLLESNSDNRKSEIENRKWVGLFAIIVALTACGVRAEAQQQGKLPASVTWREPRLPGARSSWTHSGRS